MVIMSPRFRGCELLALQSAAAVNFGHAELQLRAANAVAGMGIAEGH
jgi:hypothetical protein